MKRLLLLVLALIMTSQIQAQAKYTKNLSGFLGVRDCMVSWADINNDGDLDFIISGDTATSVNQTKPFTTLYRNDGSSFSLQGTLIRNCSNTSVAWGDYDNDNDADILIAGLDESYMSLVELYTNNGSGTFEYVSTLGTFWGVTDPKVGWADFDNDGDQDFLVAGGTSYAISVYENKYPDAFVKYDIALGGLDDNGMVLGDFDNDGDVDFVFGGYNNGVRNTYLYKNNGSFAFSENSIIIGLSECSFAAGDIDNDGDLDLMAMGTDQSLSPVTRAYFNDGTGTFVSPSYLYGVTNGSIALGDCDGDGDLDVAYSGTDVNNNDTMLVDINNGGGNFTPWAGGEEFDGIDDGKIAFGDYDNDGRLDILVSGSEYEDDTLYVPVTNVYHKTAISFINPNSLPSNTTPNLQHIVNGSEVTLSWDKYYDEGTVRNDLSYNIQVLGTGTIINSPLSDISNGYRFIVQTGNTGLKNTWTLKKLPFGDYSWKVQAIDASFAGSEWSVTDNFTIASPVTITNPSGGENWTAGTSQSITWTNSGTINEVRIEYSTDDGASWITEQEGITNTGSYNWSVPDYPTTQARIKISDKIKPADYGISNAFTITGNGSSKPVCITLAVQDITSHSVRLRSDLSNVQGLSTNVYFQILNNFDTSNVLYDNITADGSPVTFNTILSKNYDGLNHNALYTYRAVAWNSNGTTYGDTVTFWTLPGTVQFSNFSCTPNGLGQDIGVSVDISAFPSVDFVKIKYGYYFDSSMNWEEDMSSMGGPTYTKTIPGNRVTANGLWIMVSAGITGVYTSHYPGKDSAYTVPIAMSPSEIGSVRSIGQYPEGMPDNDWYSYSLPYQFNGSIDLSQVFGTQDWGDYYPDNWDAYKIMAGSSNLERVTSLLPMTGYLIYHTNGYDTHVDVNTPSNATITTDFIPSQRKFMQGWNLMPWPFPVAKDIIQKPGRAGSVWLLNESVWTKDINNKFLPYAAYAIYVNSADQPIDSIFDLYNSGTLQKKTLASDEWEIRVSAFDGRRKDECTFFGVSRTSLNAFDSRDDIKPFAVGQAVRTILKLKENEKTLELADDFRPVNMDGYSWDMQVENRGKKPSVRLSWEKMNVPAGLKIVMIDLNNNEQVDLNTADQYEFNGIAVNPFKIIAGNDSYIRQEIEKLKLPEKFTLYANYPNPFNPGTTIKYDLMRSGTVKLSVYNTLGQLVRTLVTGAAQTTGAYTVAWDGKDQLGRMSSTGVYIYRLDVKDLNGKTFTRSHKMLLIK